MCNRSPGIQRTSNASASNTCCFSATEKACSRSLTLPQRHTSKLQQMAEQARASCHHQGVPPSRGLSYSFIFPAGRRAVQRCFAPSFVRADPLAARRYNYCGPQVASALEQDAMAIQALYAVAVHCALAGWHTPVAAIFDRALQRVATLASPDDRAHRAADLVKSRVQAGLLDHTPALRVAQAIEHPAARAQALVAIAASCADLGERARALAAVDYAFATARTIQADEAGAKVLAAVADLYRQVGAREQAAEVRRLAQTWAATRRRSTPCSGSRIPTPEHGRWSGP
jgi:hypothetical protein